MLKWGMERGDISVNSADIFEVSIHCRFYYVRWNV
jgi:hypothetical protein